MTTTRTQFLGDLQGTDLRTDGVYTWPGPDGRDWKFTSVTHIIGHLSAPELQRWYARMERDNCRERLNAMKRGEISPPDLWREYDERTPWTPAAEVYRDERADLGSRVHKQVGRYVCARLYGDHYDFKELAADLAPYMISFHVWFENEKPDYYCIESPVFSREHGYAGTGDAILTIRGRRIQVDYKISGRTRKNHALQLAAYREAEFIGLRNGEEHAVPHTVGGAVLLIHPDRCKLYDWPCGAEEFAAFRALQTASEWLRSARIPQEAV